MTAEPSRAEAGRRLHEAAWPDMFANLQSAYAELAQAQFELQRRAGEIQEARDLFQRVIASMSEALFVVDTAGVVIRTNPAAAALLGMAEEALVGRPFAGVWPGGAVPRTPWELLGRARDGTIPALEVALEGPGGAPTSLSVSCSLVRDTRAKIIGMLLVARDVTEARRAEEIRARLLAREREARRLAEAASRSKDEFLATLSHELRTPLHAVMGWLAILRSSPLDAAIAERALETIDRNLKLQRQLIEDLLDVSGIISGKMRLEPRPVDLAPIVGAAIDAVRPAALARQIEIEVAFDTRGRWVQGDPDRLQQVVWNLLSNAVKFTPPGGRVTVTAACREPEMEVAVQDTGRGISPDFLPFVFERFRQADSSSTRAHGGLGLGLAIVRHLVEMHGGRVQVESAGEGCGATFRVRLPLAERGVEVVLYREPPAGEVRLDGLRVLLVEDSTDEREALATALERLGAAVRPAASVAEALRSFVEAPPDVLVSDIAMPGEDGYGLIRRLRAAEAGRDRHLPAIALTAYGGSEDRRRILLAGFQVHITKPVDPQELVAAIASLTGRARA